MDVSRIILQKILELTPLTSKHVLRRFQREGYLRSGQGDLFAAGTELHQLIAHRWDRTYLPTAVVIFPGLLVGGPVTTTFDPRTILQIFTTAPVVYWQALYNALYERDQAATERARAYESSNRAAAAQALLSIANRKRYEVSCTIDLMRAMMVDPSLLPNIISATMNKYDTANRATRTVTTIWQESRGQQLNAEQRSACFVLLLAAVVDMSGLKDSDEAEEDSDEAEEDSD